MKYSFNVYQQDFPHILPLELAAGGREVLPTYLAHSVRMFDQLMRSLNFPILFRTIGSAPKNWTV